jgi:hypothetical protein
MLSTLVLSRRCTNNALVKNFFGVLCLCLAPCLSLSAGDALSQRHAGQGELILTQLDSAPFPHPDRAQGHKYEDKFFSAEDHYSDKTVGIFIPKGFHSGKTIDFVVHFHGWANNVTSVFERYKLIEQLVESRRNAILVVPQGPRNASDSFGGKLEDAGGFKRFMADVMATLPEKTSLTNKNVAVGRIILSGHSGGYHVISSILERGGLTDHVNEVWLFDALYGQTDKFLSWFEKADGRLLDIYTENGGTKVETEKLMTTLRERNISFMALKEKGLALDALRSNRPLLLYTELEHNDVLDKHQTFRDFLATSCLGEITRN